MHGSIEYHTWRDYSIKLGLIESKLKILAMALDDFSNFKDDRLFYIRDCIEELANQYSKIVESFNDLPTIHTQPHN